MSRSTSPGSAAAHLDGAVRARAGRHTGEAGGLEVRFEPWRGAFRAPAGTEVLVNATSIGLHPDVDARVPVDLRPRARSIWPTSSPTRLARDLSATRRREGLVALDGLGMLVEQGRLGMQFWTGVHPDPGPMRAALEAAL